MIANQYETPYPRRFNSPNDIAVHPHHEGRIFFTDPTYGLMEKSRHYDGLYVHEKRDLPFQGVFEINNYLDGTPASLIDHALFRPNGIGVSHDGWTDDSGGRGTGMPAHPWGHRRVNV